MNEWISVNKQLPKYGLPVRLYNRDWIDEDLNPTGGVEGYFIPELGFQGAFWNGCQDCWDTLEPNPFPTNRSREMSNTGLQMKYFVLKPKGSDIYALASREAMLAYAAVIAEENKELCDDLRSWADSEIPELVDEPNPLPHKQEKVEDE